MKRIVLLLIACAFSGCHHSWTKSEIAGLYILDSAASGFVLDLKEDGTYVHSSVDSDGKKVSRVGIWELDNTDPDNPICLDKFVVFKGEPIGMPNSPGFFMLHPESTWNGIRFPVGDPDAPSHYFVPSKQAN